MLTSRYESFGIVLVEAMARGCYLISTELASARDIINGDESVGLVVPQNDPAALAEALRRVSSMRIDHLSIAHKAERYYYKNIIQGLPWIDRAGEEEEADQDEKQRHEGEDGDEVAYAGGCGEELGLIGAGMSSGVSLQAKPNIMPWSPAPCWPSNSLRPWPSTPWSMSGDWEWMVLRTAMEA